MKTFTLDESIEVHVAEEFELSLPGKGAQGYEWEVADITAGLAFLGHSPSQERLEDAGAEVRLGANFPEKLRFRADRPGTFTVRLVCRRPFGDADSIGTEICRVSVHPGP